MPSLVSARLGTLPRATTADQHPPVKKSRTNWPATRVWEFAPPGSWMTLTKEKYLSRRVRAHLWSRPMALVSRMAPRISGPAGFIPTNNTFRERDVDEHFRSVLDSETGPELVVVFPGIRVAFTEPGGEADTVPASVPAPAGDEVRDLDFSSDCPEPLLAILGPWLKPELVPGCDAHDHSSRWRNLRQSWKNVNSGDAVAEYPAATRPGSIP